MDEDDRDERLAAADRVVATLEEWFDAHGPDTVGTDREDTDRAVLWAHNGHVNRESNRSRSDGSKVPSMGHYLTERYGEDYYAVGFDFGSGSFQALEETTTATNSASDRWVTRRRARSRQR